MIVFPNAKINIGLNILRKRPDGYHDIETLFYPIGLKDGLEFVENHSNRVHFSNSGIQVDGRAEDNLVVKAYQLLRDEFNLPGLDIHLHKAIPFGAGLGGGSADAAFMLMAINSYFQLSIEKNRLKSIAASLGADCAFFIENSPCFATGIGDQLHPFSLDLTGWYLVLVKPDVSVSTPQAYAMVKPSVPVVPLSRKLENEIADWQPVVGNDFEPSVLPQFPEIEACKQRLIDLGAVYASMSGSGASVFGLFKKPLSQEEVKLQSTDFVWSEKL